MRCVPTFCVVMSEAGSVAETSVGLGALVLGVLVTHTATSLRDSRQFNLGMAAWSDKSADEQADLLHGQDGV